MNLAFVYAGQGSQHAGMDAIFIRSFRFTARLLIIWTLILI